MPSVSRKVGPAVTTKGVTFHSDDGQTDNWQPGDQFEVLHIYGDKVLVERANSTGWVTTADLDERTTIMPS